MSEKKLASILGRRQYGSPLVFFFRFVDGYGRLGLCRKKTRLKSHTRLYSIAVRPRELPVSIYVSWVERKCSL